MAREVGSRQLRLRHLLNGAGSDSDKRNLFLG